MIVELIKELDIPVQYVIVNEAGASVYSASKLATEEFPNFDVLTLFSLLLLYFAALLDK